MPSSLTANQALTVGQSIVSPNGRFDLILQGDGNLVLYGPGAAPLWSSNTHGQYAVQEVIMQGDGNLVMYDNSGHALWNSGSARPNAIAPFVQIQDDGNLVIYNTQSLWSTNTHT